MTHYPTWIALFVFSAAFAAVNVVGTVGTVGPYDYQWDHGWPATWGSRVIFNPPVNPPVALNHFTRQHWVFDGNPTVDRASLTIDLLIALAVIGGATLQVAKIKAKLSLQVAFAMMAIVGASCLTLQFNELDELLVNARAASLFIIPVAIGLAGLSALNLLGWVYGRVRRERWPGKNESSN